MEAHSIKAVSYTHLDVYKRQLLLLDDDTLLVNEELLKGLDEELDAFLKDLLEK